jgi:hypothetical protein
MTDEDEMANCAAWSDGYTALFVCLDALPLRMLSAQAILLLKRIWGALMAKLIRTGELEAIDLKHLHSYDILYIDEEIEETLAGKTSNGGFADIFLDLRAGIVGLIEFIKTTKAEQRKKRR